MPDFVRGLELAGLFYADVVRPLLEGRAHVAARIGPGSDVLGFDTERSTDHGWGPRLHVFVAASDVETTRAAVDSGLPETFRGWPVRFGWDAIETRHHVQISTLTSWLEDQLGFDPQKGIAIARWLATPQQLLLEVTAGAVFHDPERVLGRLREKLAWYPDDVWLWLMACQWRRIGQEEAFVGRTAEVGDELGSRVVAARLVRDLMRLCFLQERRYAPYGKWLGTSFRGLPTAARAEAAPGGSTRGFGASSPRSGALPGIRDRRPPSQRVGPHRGGGSRGARLLRPAVSRARRRSLRGRMRRADRRRGTQEKAADRRDRPARGHDGRPELRIHRAENGGDLRRRLKQHHRPFPDWTLLLSMTGVAPPSLPMPAFPLFVQRFFRNVGLVPLV